MTPEEKENDRHIYLLYKQTPLVETDLKLLAEYLTAADGHLLHYLVMASRETEHSKSAYDMFRLRQHIAELVAQWHEEFPKSPVR